MTSLTPLPPALPPGYVEQRTALHRLATYVIAPVRHRATGRFGLRWTPGGFETPAFAEVSDGDDTVVRVVGTRIEKLVGREIIGSTEISTLRSVAEFLTAEIDAETAAEHDSPPVGDPDAPLGVTAEAVAVLDGWWALGSAALEVLRADDVSVDPSEVQLWPGHFDTAIEVGDEDRRASVGASPGDDGSAEPYLYVSAWWPDRLNIDPDNQFWNATGYTGAVLSYSAVQASDDPLATAVAFFRRGRDELLAS